MEQKIFKWEDWDEIETGMFQFHDIELKCQVGKFAPKTKFDHATLDYNKGTLTLGTGGIYYCYRLMIMVGELLHEGL